MTAVQKPQELEKQVRLVLEAADSDCLKALEAGPAGHFGFPGLTWLWGPELYRRNRVLFRPLLLAKFSSQTWSGGWRWKNTPWSPRLQSWLEAVEQDQDVELSQRLLGWKLAAQANFDYKKLAALMRSELKTRITPGLSPAQRMLELRKLDVWFALDEPTALHLYAQDPATAPYILRHLPRREKKFWQELFSQALARDERFAYQLYRALVPEAQWESDVVQVCNQFAGADTLVQELSRRSPFYLESERFAGVLLKVLQLRGRDAFAYVIPQLQRVWKPLFGRGNYGKLLELADKQGWDDLWCALLRTSAPPKEFNATLRKLISAKNLARMSGLSGVSAQWNFGSLGLARVQILEGETVLALYAANPQWLRGAFKLNLQVYPQQEGYLPVLRLFIEKGEEELVDLLAGRFLVGYKSGPEIDLLTDYYSRLAHGRARRSANVLGKLPAFCIHNYPELMRKNRLARLLYERSLDEYAADSQALADLVEASEIHAMTLGYRALAQADPAEAVRHLTLLLGCLLRPMQRRTRIWALQALGQAARLDESSAAKILAAAREAQRMPDLRYPKEELLGLLASILDAWPQLRRPSEQPVVYRRQVSLV